MALREARRCRRQTPGHKNVSTSRTAHWRPGRPAQGVSCPDRVGWIGVSADCPSPGPGRSGRRHSELGTRTSRAKGRLEHESDRASPGTDPPAGSGDRPFQLRSSGQPQRSSSFMGGVRTRTISYVLPLIRRGAGGGCSGEEPSRFLCGAETRMCELGGTMRFEHLRRPDLAGSVEP